MRTRVLLLFVLLVGCAKENLPFSSGELTGVVTPPPADWTAIAADEVVQFETRAPDPYSVNLWVLGQGQRLYVFAGGSRSNWVEDIELNPNVRMKIGDASYELTAARVHDADEFETFAQGWQAKYGNRPWNDDVRETYLMRLNPTEKDT